jgi:hypothetical protein
MRGHFATELMTAIENHFAYDCDPRLTYLLRLPSQSQSAKEVKFEWPRILFESNGLKIWVERRRPGFARVCIFEADRIGSNGQPGTNYVVECNMQNVPGTILNYLAAHMLTARPMHVTQMAMEACRSALEEQPLPLEGTAMHPATITYRDSEKNSRNGEAEPFASFITSDAGSVLMCCALYVDESSMQARTPFLTLCSVRSRGKKNNHAFVGYAPHVHHNGERHLLREVRKGVRARV